MKKSLLLFFVVSVFTCSFAVAQTGTFCNPNGNVIIYSNYDGGVLDINVDQNIPNIKIGVVTYEPVTINISGTYASNVTEVRYAGYVSTNNQHCSNSPTTTTITGAGSAATSVNFLPTATYANANGYSMIICNYTCSTTTNQGGCNTPDQIVDYFMTNFGGTFYYHFTQYGCWSGPYNVSDGGNCCAAPPALGVSEMNAAPQMNIAPNPSNGNFYLTFSSMEENAVLEVRDLLGETVMTLPLVKNQTVADLSLDGMAKGVYILHFSNGTSSADQKIVVQ